MPGDSPDNIGHAELEIGTGMVMLADEFPDHGLPLAAQSIGGTPVTVHVYVDDADAVFATARGRRAPPSPGRWRTSSTATVRVSSSTRGVTGGTSPATSRTSPRRRWRRARRRARPRS